jgi:hypothetical protein
MTTRATDLSLAGQQAKLARLIEGRRALYRTGVAKGRMNLEDAARHDQELVALWRTFVWFVANADWIRAEAQARRLRAEAEAARAAELAALAEHPDVQAVQAAFPGAVLADVRPLTPTPQETADAAGCPDRPHARPAAAAGDCAHRSSGRPPTHGRDRQHPAGPDQR